MDVQYRSGDILLSASGTFVGDSGRSIFLEQHLEQRGKRNYFRWEIPYPYIHRIEVVGAASAPPPNDVRPLSIASIQKMADPVGAAPSIVPFPQRPKTA